MADGVNMFEITEYIRFPSGDSEPDGIQQEEGFHKGEGGYGQEVCIVDHEISKNLLSSYMKEVGRIPLLTAEEERALAKEIQERQRNLIRRLLKLDPKIDEVRLLTRKKWNVSDDLLAAIVAKLEELERGSKLSHLEVAFLSEISDLYGRLNQLKGEMLKRNLRLVIKIAREYLHVGISLSDLVQEGNLGLMRAVTKFDYKRGCRFSTYATWWIRQAILRATVEKERTIRIPVHLMEKRRKLAKTCRNFVKNRGKPPQPEEIARSAKVPLKVVHKALFPLPQTVSLEIAVGEDSSLQYLIKDEKSPSPFEVMEREEISQMVEKALSHLPPREAEVLRLRFGIGRDGEHTLEEIGRKFGISRERVRQLEKRAVNRLRHWKKRIAGKNGEKYGVERVTEKLVLKHGFNEILRPGPK